MRGTFLGVILMISAATRMGCGETIMPCSTDADRVLDFDFRGDHCGQFFLYPCRRFVGGFVQTLYT